MASAPNIILCMCDQLRAFEAGCYGNTVIRTPALDRIAAEGVRFETAVTNYPICMAARSVLLSGQYNRTCTGGIANIMYPGGRPGDCPLPEYPFDGRPHIKDPTLPELLRARGYHTSAIGKWHIHSWPHDIGFDHYLIPRVHHCHSGQSYTEDGGPEFVPPGWSVDFEAERVAQHLADRAKSQQPFFLLYNISPPHCPLADMPEEYLTMYGPDEVPLRPNVDPDLVLERQDYWFRVYRWDFRHYSHHLPHTEVLPEGYSLRHLTAEYYGATTWMDSAVGRMLDALDATGMAENTIVVFTSDHGDSLGSHGLVQKNSPNEEAIRVPLLLRWPAGAPRGEVVRGSVASLADIAPTLLDLAGAPAAGHMQGGNLAPLRGGTRVFAGADHAIIETSAGVAVRTADRMAFLPFGADGRTPARAATQAFDLAEDPYEFDNLAHSSTARGAIAPLVDLVQAWHARTPFMR
jgi:arylsulfatase A-like enzyme